MTSFPVELAGGTAISATSVRAVEDLLPALAALGLLPPRPVVVVVGGAGRMADEELERLLPVFVDGVAPVLARLGALAIDGGTHAGVMLLLGRARSATGGRFPLVGVVAGETVDAPGTGPTRVGAAELDPNHTHVVLVPGREWGDETLWMSRTATALAGSAASVTVLVNGGDIAWADARCSVDAGRPVLTVEGSGRAADELAAALRGSSTDPRAVALAGSGLVTAAPVHEPAAVASALAALLQPDRPTAGGPLLEAT